MGGRKNCPAAELHSIWQLILESDDIRCHTLPDVTGSRALEVSVYSRVRGSTPFARSSAIIPVRVGILRVKSTCKVEPHQRLLVSWQGCQATSSGSDVCILEASKVFPVGHGLGNNTVPAPLQTHGQFHKVEGGRIETSNRVLPETVQVDGNPQMLDPGKQHCRRRSMRWVKKAVCCISQFHSPKVQRAHDTIFGHSVQYSKPFRISLGFDHSQKKAWVNSWFIKRQALDCQTAVLQPNRRPKWSTGNPKKSTGPCYATQCSELAMIAGFAALELSPERPKRVQSLSQGAVGALSGEATCAPKSLAKCLT